MSQESPPGAAPLNGWEPSAPPADTALRQFLLAQAAFQRMAGRAIDATVVENDRFVAVDTGRPASYINMALLRQPLCGAPLEQTMNELEAIYGKPGATGACGLYSPLPTPDLSNWGWTLAGHPPLQIRSPLSPVLDTGNLRVQRVVSRAELRVFEQIMVEGFGMSEMRSAAPGSLIGVRLLEEPTFGAWLGYLDDIPIAGAASVVEAGVVVIVMVATLPAARRKGAGLAVTQAATRPALKLPAVLFSSDDGRPVYEKLGFLPVLRGAFWYRTR